MVHPKNWSFLVTPMLVARMTSSEFEIKRLDTNEWEVCNDPIMRESVIKNGTVVSEEQALKAHELLKT